MGVACGVPSRCVALAAVSNRYISAPPASPCLTCALAHRTSACVLKRHLWGRSNVTERWGGGICTHRNSAKFIDRPEPSTQAVPGEYEAMQGVYIASGHPIALMPSRTHVHTHATSVTQPMIGVNRYAAAFRV
jgi:hypothetical protein